MSITLIEAPPIVNSSAASFNTPQRISCSQCATHSAVDGSRSGKELCGVRACAMPRSAMLSARLLCEDRQVVS